MFICACPHDSATARKLPPDIPEWDSGTSRHGSKVLICSLELNIMEQWVPGDTKTTYIYEEISYKRVRQRPAG